MLPIFASFVCLKPIIWIGVNAAQLSFLGFIIDSSPCRVGRGGKGGGEACNVNGE